LKLEMKVEYRPGERGEFIQVIEERCTGCVECGACWNVCESDAVVFGEPRGGTGVKFAYG
jgi:ferredoxin-like protein FixX